MGCSDNEEEEEEEVDTMVGNLAVQSNPSKLELYELWSWSRFFKE